MITLRAQLILATLLFAFQGSHSLAEEKPAATALTLTPAAETSPALKYELLPPYLDRHTGNAAPFYTKAFLVLSDAGIDSEQWDLIVTWLETPPEELPRDEVRKTLGRFETTWGELQLAATRDHCHWDLGVRERKNIFGTLLPEVQQFRAAGRLVALKSRLHIAAGEFEQAIETLQVGCALARDVSKQPFLISGLVGVAVASQMSDQLEVLIATPDAPNLYWAIAALPQPLIDPRPALELEGSTLFLMFPELQDIDAKEMTPHQWRQAWRSIFVNASQVFGAGPPSKIEATARRLAMIATADALVEKRYPIAKKNLIDQGHAADKVAAMSKSQVVTLNEVAQFRQIRDEMFKWAHVPYWQAREGLIATERRLEAEKGDDADDNLSPTSLVHGLLPSVNAALASYQIAGQRLAALQTIEAMRMHAAAHDGQLPKSLGEIKAVPLPVNPFTGKVADYAIDNGVATITLPAPEAHRTLTFELRCRK